MTDSVVGHASWGPGPPGAIGARVVEPSAPREEAQDFRVIRPVTAAFSDLCKLFPLCEPVSSPIN